MCAMVGQILGEGRFSRDCRCQIHSLIDHVHLCVSANAIPLLEDPPSFLTTPHPSFLQSLPKNCV